MPDFRSYQNSNRLCSLAKLKGAKVITTVSSEEKANFCKALGADHTIIYSSADIIDEVQRLTNNKGADLIIDTVGAEVFKQSISCAAYFGRLITLLDPGEQSLAEARIKNLLIGFELMLTPQLKQLNNARDKQVEILKKCTTWIEQGMLNAHISNNLTLDQVALGHNQIEQGHTTGKIIITM